MPHAGHVYALALIATFLSLTALRWPPRWQRLGLLPALGALLLALGLQWGLLAVGGSWFALGRWWHSQALPTRLDVALVGMSDVLATGADQFLPGLPLNLGAALLFCLAYVALRTVLVILVCLGLRQPVLNGDLPDLGHWLGWGSVLILAALPWAMFWSPWLWVGAQLVFWPGLWLLFVEWLHGSSHPR